MVSETTRNEVWQSLLDVARLIRYYDAYANRRRLYHFVLRSLLLFAAAGGVANMLAVLPDFVVPAVSVAIAVLVVVDFACNYARQAAVLRAIGRECGKLEVEWKNLWADVNTGNVSDKKALSINRELARQLLEATSWAGDADIRENRKLNEKCAEAVTRSWRSNMPADGGKPGAGVVIESGKPARPSEPAPPPPPPAPKPRPSSDK